MLTKLRKTKKGFTLIELIIVIAILAILAAVIVPMIIGYIDQSNQSTALSNVTVGYTSFMTAVADFEATGAAAGGLDTRFEALVGTGAAANYTFVPTALAEIDTMAEARGITTITWNGTTAGNPYNATYTVATGVAAATIRP